MTLGCKGPGVELAAACDAVVEAPVGRWCPWLGKECTLWEKWFELPGGYQCHPPEYSGWKEVAWAMAVKSNSAGKAALIDGKAVMWFNEWLSRAGWSTSNERMSAAAWAKRM